MLFRYTVHWYLLQLSVMLCVWQRSWSLCSWWLSCPSDARQHVEVVDIQQPVRVCRWCQQRLVDDPATSCQVDVSRRASGGRDKPAAPAWTAALPTRVWLFHCAAGTLLSFSFQVELYSICTWLLCAVSVNCHLFCCYHSGEVTDSWD